MSEDSIESEKIWEIRATRSNYKDIENRKPKPNHFALKLGVQPNNQAIPLLFQLVTFWFPLNYFHSTGLWVVHTTRVLNWLIDLQTGKKRSLSGKKRAYFAGTETRQVLLSFKNPRGGTAATNSGERPEWKFEHLPSAGKITFCWMSQKFWNVVIQTNQNTFHEMKLKINMQNDFKYIIHFYLQWKCSMKYFHYFLTTKWQVRIKRPTWS